MTRVLVTGGAGFIGSNLVARAARARRRGARARQLLDRQPREPRRRSAATSRWSRATSARTSASIPPSAGVEVVFHQGALGSVPRSVQDPLTSTAVNVEGTLNVLLAARDEGVRRVVARLVVVGLRRRRHVPAGREPGAEPDLAVRRREARRRALLRQLHRASTGSRRSRCATSTSSGRARTRPRSTPRSCRGSSRAIADGRAGHDLRRRRAVARLHLRRQRRRGEPRSPRTRPAAGGRILNIATGGSETVNALADTIGGAARPAGREDVRTGAARRRARVVGGRHRRARERSGTSRRVGFEEGLAPDDRRELRREGAR